MPRVSVQKSALYALGAYLENQLAIEGLVVRDEWPAQGDLPPKMITVIPVGKPQDERLQEVLAGSEELDPDDPKAATDRLYSYRVKARTQPFQLDVWATFEGDRQEIVDALDSAFQQGTAITLSQAARDAAGNPQGELIRDGVLLELDAEQWGHAGFADITVDPAEPMDDAGAVQQYERRSMIRGQASVELIVKAQSPRMARVFIQNALDGATDTLRAI